MKKFFFALFLFATILNCFADSRVFTLVNPHPEEVLEALHNIYGDKIHAELVQGRLLVVGSGAQLDEIAARLVKLDPTPRALRLTLRDQPPADENPDTITYSTEKNGYTIDTVEGAFVNIDYETIAQQVTGAGIRFQNDQQTTTTTAQNGARSTSNGWWVTIDNVPVRFDSLTLRITIEGGRRAIALVSYAKEENQERRVYGNTVIGNLGAWIPLLPRPSVSDDGSISSGPKAGEQLYLRVDRNFEKKNLR